jgi:predicted hotdog family 3-hydroxylacyl-ACP dehydratase
MNGAKLAARLGREWIAARIPHSGSMCLLDSVDAWHADGIVCRATSHRAPDNPLRSKGRLAAVCGIEYAAQAMAAHGALLGAEDGRRPRVGVLASVRGVRAYVERLDTLDDALTIEATRIGGDDTTVLYRFELHCGAQLIAEGRAAVMLDAAHVLEAKAR